MNTRCPNCGAVHSLDSIIGNDDAARLLKFVLELDADVGKAAVRYIGLFRPAKSQLSFGRVAKLLEELLPDMQAQTVRRDGVDHPAPPAAWLYGFTACLDARDTGRLKPPLKSHGYLYEIISKWQQPMSPTLMSETSNKLPVKTSQTVAAAAQLEGLKR